MKKKTKKTDEITILKGASYTSCSVKTVLIHAFSKDVISISVLLH